jgi:hypothetical protein
MTDIIDKAAQRTPLRITNERTPSCAPRKWVRAALASLLAVLLMAGGYWYVTGVNVTDDPYLDVGASGISTDAFSMGKNVACASLSCVRSPRSRLSPRAIVGRPESRQGNLHLAALLFHPEAGPPIAMTIGRILLLDVAPHMLIGLQQGRGY